MTTEPKTPARLADDAAEAVRLLAHATLPRKNVGWEFPDDAYSTVANLAILADRLTQAVGQAEGFVGEMEDTGRLRSDHGPDDLKVRLLAFHSAMAEATQKTRALYAALDRAHQALGSIRSAE